MKRYAISMFWVKTMEIQPGVTKALERISLDIVTGVTVEEAIGKLYLKRASILQDFDLRYVAKMEIPEIGDIDLSI